MNVLEKDAYGSSTHFTTCSYLVYILWVAFVFVSVLIAVYAKLYPMQYMLAKVRLLTITAHCPQRTFHCALIDSLPLTLCLLTACLKGRGRLGDGGLAVDLDIGQQHESSRRH